MPKIPDCDRCLLYSHNPHLICAVNPNGVEGKSCPDFQPDSNAEEEELWAPVGWKFEGDELVQMNYED